MENSREFLKLVLDSITEHIVVIDQSGNIQFVNESWSAFGNNNSCTVGDGWSGVNYIDECDKAAAMGDDFGANAGEGIRKVIAQDQSIFYFEYPCHSPNKKRWFMMRVTPFQVGDKNYFVISHQNITERKLAEEEVNSLARIDGLTGIPNRRTFDDLLNNEMKRCARLNQPICLAIVDLDHFKLLNDTYGHQAGDNCLVEIGKLMKLFANRPGDICARYGGEEFALVWSNIPLENSEALANKLLEKIAGLNIPNAKSPTESYLTTSIGLAEIIPDKSSKSGNLIAKADALLYKAKESGRNRVMCERYA